MNFLYLIPARGGSKGVPGKNIKELNGKPLIHYSIEHARAMTADENICVSSDSLEIIKTSNAVGLSVPFTRPGELATDEASMQDVILHAINFYASINRLFDAVVLLQPTSPLRTAGDIGAAISLYAPDLDMVMSVQDAKANPYFILFEEKDGFLVKSKEGDFNTRQSAPKVFQANGAVYVINVKSLRKQSMRKFERVRKMLMDDVSSVDIDSPMDWAYCEFLMEKGYNFRKSATQ